MVFYSILCNGMRCVRLVCLITLPIQILHLAMSVGETMIWNLAVLVAILRALQSWTWLCLNRKKMRKLTDYFAPATTRPTRMLYFLQRYKPLEPVTKAREDGTGGGLNRESPAAILGPSSSHDNQHDQWAFWKWLDHQSLVPNFLCRRGTL